MQLELQNVKSNNKIGNSSVKRKDGRYYESRESMGTRNS